MKLLYKTSFRCFLLALVIIVLTNGANAQMQSPVGKGNFTSFTSPKTYSDIAKLTNLTPLKYRNHPDFGKRVNDSTEWYEQINKRTLNTRTFIGPGNEIIIESAYDNINYVDENGWIKAADTKLQSSQNGWSSVHQEIPVYLYADASTALSLGNKELMVFNKNVHFNQEGISVNNYTVGDNGMYIKNVVPNTDKSITFGRGSVETDYTIKQPIKLNGDLFISEDIILPSGYTISENTDAADENRVSLTVLAPDGKMAAEIRSPLCYDNHNKNSITGLYHIQKQSGGYKLEIQVPSSWLNDPSRQYPVTIDPVINGPVSMWTHGKIPSCLKPSYGSGTIVDTVPAGITITHFFVQGSYYAYSVEGKNVFLDFTTTCANTGFIFTNDTVHSENIVIYGSIDYHSPLTCCIHPSCSEQTFNLTMEVTRDSGGTTCDSTQYAWYDPTLAATDEGNGFPAMFESYVIGRTVYDSTWSITPASICANQCSLTLTATVYAGVPPYTLKYAKKDSAWTKDTTSFGTRIGCNFIRGTGALTLNIPNCPRPSCKPDTTYSVPAPTIIDACGNVVGSISPISLPVNEVPNVTASPETVCSGNNVNLALLSCITSTYAWKGSNDSVGTGNPISDIVNNNGTTNDTVEYTVTPTGNGCPGDATVFPVIVTPFTVNINPTNPILCKGSTVTLIVTGDANQYSWSQPGDNTVTGLSCLTCADPVANDSVTNTYEVKGTKNGTSCTAFDKVTVVVYTPPTDTASPLDTTVFAGQSVKLIAHSNGSVTWSPSTGLSATTGDTVIATPSTTTNYYATATLPGDPCPGLADLLIKVNITLIVPGAFTPNSGDENARLHVLPNSSIGLSLQTFRVYNRWGQMVYETNSMDAPGWDGTFNGKPQPMGTYVYYAEFYRKGQSQLLSVKGDITLIR